MLTYRGVSDMTGAPVATVRLWVRGVRVGCEDHERTEFLRARVFPGLVLGFTQAEVYAFVRGAWSHRTFRSVHPSLIALAFEAAPKGGAPKRFRVAAPVA